MKRLSWFLSLIILLAFTSNTFAADLPQRVIGHDRIFTSGSTDFTKTEVDTIFLIGPWGSGAQVNGQFQDTSGNPAWNGWTHYDETQATVTHWHVSDYNADNLPGGPANLAAFCGDETFASCTTGDPVGGYGNNWEDLLEFSFVVADPSIECIMQVSGIFNSNTEPGYDSIIFRYETADGFVDAAYFDSIQEAEVFDFSHSYESTDYVGENNDEVRFQIRVYSDGGWSDEDCDYYGNGAIQVDDLRVQCSNGSCDIFTDFQDGTTGDWYYAYPRGVGDFTDIWVGLADLDPCHENTSPQVAFIDDGTKVDGVGPSYCLNWCYGPGGYIVNTTGGARLVRGLSNFVESPVVAWPGNGYAGAEFAFDVYQHEDLSADAPAIFYTWDIRSTADEENHPIADQGWNSRHYVYYGGPNYLRAGNIVSDMLEPDVTHVQVQLQCVQLGWLWGWYGDDGYPAPYFDNVRVTAYEIFGPAMSAREINLAQDNFRELEGPIDLENLESNFVRFDAAISTAINTDIHNTPGDSIAVDIGPARSGAELLSSRLIYTLKRNPVFDSARDPNWDISGFTDGIQVGLTSKYAFDLPDSGFLFPGDILHYYFEATDAVNLTDTKTSIMPADTTGFGNFNHPTEYNSSFQVHALPSIKAGGDQPSILFWNDNANRGGQDDWHNALNDMGLFMGEQYDVYYTNGPSSGVGNGLGGRAVLADIDGYTDLLYTCGDLGVTTISNGDPSYDRGRDTELLLDWFDSETGRDAFFCGDNLASDMANSGSLNGSFLTEIMNVEVSTFGIRSFIHNQMTPAVLPQTGNSVFSSTPGWIADGGCFGINSFDGVIAGAGAERLARFTNPSGLADYEYSAATLNIHGNDRIITMPHGFMYVLTDPNNPVGHGVTAQESVLMEILTFFGIPGYWPPADVPEMEKFTTHSYPNPFNPTTRIAFNMPKEGHLTLKVYNVRGELVKTLVDETRPQGTGHIMWDGSNGQDSQVASGVYFYEARTGGEVRINKMMLIK